MATLYPVMEANFCSSALSILQSLDELDLGTKSTDFTLRDLLEDLVFFLFIFLEKLAVFFCPPLLLNHDVFSRIFFLILSVKEDFADLCSFVPDSFACATFLLKLLIPETMMNLTWLRL